MGPSRLRAWNAWLAALHLAQGVLLWALSNDFALPVNTSFLRAMPGQGLVPAPETLVRIRIGPLVAAFLFLSALAHLALATFGRSWYERMLERGIQPARWIEYSASSSLMIVVIAMLTGIYDVAALILVFALNATMILFGWLMETRNEGRERVDWMPFWFGVFAGAVPWIAIGVYLVGAGGEGAGPPGFVYGIYASLFVFFNVFAINMVLQYRRVGRWRDYRYGERVYMLLSLFAKSALAWQVFAGTLRPA
ncbi:MAG TPA: heliorhodopsin HeR [Actinomycetota bacterium]|nr:heliorhodopsin HeR [Actinomycetota bacterium]